MRRIAKILSGALLIFSSLCAGEVYIIGTADLHGNINALAEFAGVFRRYPDAVKVDAGDLIQGDFTAVETRGVPMLEALNTLGYDVWVPGNHEFEFDEADFIRWSHIFRGRILGAQWKFEKFSPAAYTVIKRGKYRIGVIGLGESHMAEQLKFSPGVSWGECENALRTAVDGLRGENCHAVILVCHIAVQGSYGEIYRLLQKFPEIDAVISAHSHQEHRGEIIAGRLTAQPGARGSAAVLLTLSFDADGKLDYVKSKLLRPQRGIYDPEISAIARRAREKVYPRGMKNYGIYPDMDSFGNAAAEALRLGSGASAALVRLHEKYFRRRMNGWNLYRLFPFRNKVVLVDMTPDELRRIAARLNDLPRRCFISVSTETGGGRVTVAMSDFLCRQIAELKDAEIIVPGIFERETIAGQLEKSLSETIL